MELPAFIGVERKGHENVRPGPAHVHVLALLLGGACGVAGPACRCCAEAAIVAATAVLPASKGAGDAEEAAAVKIQSAFLSYLARMALCALRGMVKLQALARGQLVRRQANMTLRRIQALVSAQRRASAERLRLLENGIQNPRETMDRDSEENVKVVEVDNGGGAARARRSGCCSTPGKAELYQKVSPTPSALTDTSPRTFSARSEEYSVSFSATSEASRRHRGTKACHVAADHQAALLFPNYMANTESSRARARSQSAPRHRRVTVSEATSPSPSCELPPSGSGGRRRESLDPRDLAVARVPSPRSSYDAARVERCVSQACASASATCPWAVTVPAASVGRRPPTVVSSATTAHK